MGTPIRYVPSWEQLPRHLRERRDRASKGEACWYCRRPMVARGSIEHQADPSLEATIEHIKPQADGGKDDRDNTVAACARCNGLRGRMSYVAFLEFARTMLRNYPDAPLHMLKRALDYYVNELLEIACGKPKMMRDAARLTLFAFDEELNPKTRK